MLTGEERLAFARQVVRESASPPAVLDALAILDAAGDPLLRESIIHRYGSCQPRDDPGCVVRSELIRFLRTRAVASDVPLLDEVCRTYEFVPPDADEVAGDLRRAGLLCLADLDPSLAEYHAVRLLTDKYTAPMSGEPAVTSVRLLRDREQLLPLYAYASGAVRTQVEVLAECLRSLTVVPGSVARELAERHLHDDTNEQVLLALFDMLLEHPDRRAAADLVLDFLRTTSRMDLFRYVATAIVAGRDPDLIHLVQELGAGSPPGTPRGEILAEALALLPPA
ncbi:MAG: hypothetical protein J2P45_07135 [Candidatus Dormibacteraeota bacterium]|nr:hypothetical protein [Candidatus Dormibacteraeota bacterium]